MPYYLFLVTYTTDISLFLHTKYILSYLITFGCLSCIVGYISTKKTPTAAVYMRILASGYTNNIMYTVPAIMLLLGDATAAVIGNIIQILIIQPIIVSCLQLIQHPQQSMLKKIRHIITTPYILTPILGITLHYLHIPLPYSVIYIMPYIATWTSYIALFSFGLMIGGTHITRACLHYDILHIVFAKNILHPLIAICVAYCMYLDDYWLYSLVIASCAPTAFIVYFIATQFSVEEDIVRKTIVLSSIGSLIPLMFIALIISHITITPREILNIM